MSFSLTMAEPTIDPVCGMTVDPSSAVGSALHNGQTYYFCSAHCLERFRTDPGRYTGASPNREPHHRQKADQYTCPMHPEVMQAGPGACPKCGMALEPVVPGAGEENDVELHEMRRRLVWSVSLTSPLFVLAMAPMIPGVNLPHGLHRASNWIGLALSTPVVFWVGAPFFARAWIGLCHRTSNMFTLISLGTTAAWCF